MTEPIIEVENLSKQYRLGEVSTGTVAQDINRWWARIRGKADPTLAVTHSNDRTASIAEKNEYVWALQNINFEVSRGELLGIIGRNGAGKSTLLKILSRVTAPTTGEIRLAGSLASLLEIGTGFHPELTGRENIFLNGAILGMTKAEVCKKLEEIVEFSGCAQYLDTPVKRYSSGMIVRLGFAVAAHLEPDILIVDEVLAVGDAEFQNKCVGKMQDVASHGRTVLFVSHNMAAIERLCTSCLVIDRGGVLLRGEPQVCIDTYLSDGGPRDDFEVEDFSGGELELEHFGLTYNGQPISDLYEDGGDLGFELRLNAEHSYSSFAVHIGLYTHLGTLVFLHQSDSESRLNLGQGAKRLRCTLGKIPLASGQYYCNLLLLDKGSPLLSGPRILSFRVVAAAQHKGGASTAHPILAPFAHWVEE